jgi:hypothetical protein
MLDFSRPGISANCAPRDREKPNMSIFAAAVCRGAEPDERAREQAGDADHQCRSAAEYQVHVSRATSATRPIAT